MVGSLHISTVWEFTSQNGIHKHSSWYHQNIVTAKVYTIETKFVTFDKVCNFHIPNEYISRQFIWTFWKLNNSHYEQRIFHNWGMLYYIHCSQNLWGSLSGKFFEWRPCKFYWETMHMIVVLRAQARIDAKNCSYKKGLLSR